jgi:hypothetical protein
MSIKNISPTGEIPKTLIEEMDSWAPYEKENYRTWSIKEPIISEYMKELTRKIDQEVQMCLMPNNVCNGKKLLQRCKKLNPFVINCAPGFDKLIKSLENKLEKLESHWHKLKPNEKWHPDVLRGVGGLNDDVRDLISFCETSYDQAHKAYAEIFSKGHITSIG